jgi:hypothetical protein
LQENTSLADFDKDGKAITKWISKIYSSLSICINAVTILVWKTKDFGDLIPCAESKPVVGPTWSHHRYAPGDAIGVERLEQELTKDVRVKYVESYLHTCVCLHATVNN